MDAGLFRVPVPSIVAVIFQTLGLSLAARLPLGETPQLSRRLLPCHRDAPARTIRWSKPARIPRHTAK
jgi:hypothetical protein